MIDKSLLTEKDSSKVSGGYDLEDDYIVFHQGEKFDDKENNVIYVVREYCRLRFDEIISVEEHSKIGDSISYRDFLVNQLIMFPHYTGNL